MKKIIALVAGLVMATFVMLPLTAASATVKAPTTTAASVTCANYWDQNIGWSGGFQWNDTLYAGYCWNGTQVWHQYGPDCSVSVNWQGIGGSPYGNATTACFTAGDYTSQLVVGYDWSWYVYLSPWATNPGNYLRFTVNAQGQITGRWGQAGV